MLVGIFLTDPIGWLLPVPDLTGVDFFDPHPRVADIPPAFLAEFWLFIFSGVLVSSTLLVTVSKFCCGRIMAN